jgi:enamine deaminase RidA (YjgF/YER057c/UK114 family)
MMPVKLAQAAARCLRGREQRGNQKGQQMTRRSIEVPGLRHGALPIPLASVVGNLLVSGGINPVDPESGATPDDTDEQVAIAFANVRRVLAAAGGTPEDIVKCTVFVQDKAIRPVIDKYWVEMFPDEASRPARHTLRTDLRGRTQLQLEIMAVLGQGLAE